MTIKSNLKAKPAFTILCCSLLLIPALAACSTSEAQNTSPSSAEVSAPDNAIKIGVLVTDNASSTREHYASITSPLEEAVGRPIVIVPVPQESQLSMVEKGDVDFIISNPIASEKMHQLYGTKILATIAWPEVGSQYAGSIIVKPDSPITSISELKGKQGICVSMLTSGAGCIFQMYHLQEKGLNPYIDVTLKENPSQQKIVQMVLDEQADFGFVRMDQLQRMVNEGTLSNVDELRVLEPVRGTSSPFTHTTRIYPGWAVSATADVPETLVAELQSALLNMPAKNGTLSDSGIERFEPPADYTQVDPVIDAMNLLSEHRLKS